MLSTRSNTYQNLKYRGNKDLVERFKTAFFCSRKYPKAVMAKSSSWAQKQKNKGNCIISGFHSQIERNLLHILVENEQTVIMVLARSLYQRLPDQKLKTGLDTGNLLIASAFDEGVQRASKATARKRNKLMIKMADDIMVAHARPGGSLSRLLRPMKASRKVLHTIDIPENNHLTEKGFYAV